MPLGPYRLQQTRANQISPPLVKSMQGYPRSFSPPPLNLCQVQRIPLNNLNCSELACGGTLPKLHIRAPYTRINAWRQNHQNYIFQVGIKIKPDGPPCQPCSGQSWSCHRAHGDPVQHRKCVSFRICNSRFYLDRPSELIGYVQFVCIKQ